MAKVNKDALTQEQVDLLHLIKGTLDALPIEPAPGSRKLANRVVRFTTSDSAAVNRAEGTDKDGFDSEPGSPPAGLEITTPALLLMLERSGVAGGARAEKLWAECIRDSLKMGEPAFPPAALAALAVVQAEQPAPPPPERRRSRTPAKRTGAKEVEIEIERVHAGKKSAASVRPSGRRSSRAAG